MRRPVSVMTLAGTTLTLLMISTLFLAFNVRPARSSPATIIVPDDYPTIQAAIDNASAGDTIFVRAGTYDCHVQIDKALTLKGENNQNTILRLTGSARWAFGIQVIASNVTISGFSLTCDPNYASGIFPVMLVVLDGRGTVCANNTIMDNILTGRGNDALAIIGSSGNRILSNSISNQPFPWPDVPYGYQDGSCMFLDSSRNDVISYNTLVGGWAGMELCFCDYNVILGNDISNQTQSVVDGAGVNLVQSGNNVVVGNRLTGNKNGIGLIGAIDNIIYHNDFMQNLNDVLVGSREASVSVNSWDDGYLGGGNYWSSYAGVDSYSGVYQNVTGSDGIGDTPVTINSNNIDHFPLLNPWQKITGDVNMDGRVDGKDLGLVGPAFASYGPDFWYPGSPPSPRWDPNADVNGDNIIDGKDLGIVAWHFGEHYL